MSPIAVLAALWLSAVSPATLPVPIAELVKSRETKTAEWHWSMSRTQKGDAVEELYVTRVTPDDLWQSRVGRSVNESLVGNVGTKQGGESVSVENSLVSEGIAWHIQNADYPLGGANAIPLDEPQRFLPFDFSFAGMAPTWGDANETVLGLRADWIDGLDSADVSQFTQGAWTFVIADYGDRRLEWKLDASQGGQPTQAKFFMGDRLLCWSNTKYDLAVERWVPRRIDFYWDGSETPSRTIQVDEATFNQPSHCQEVTPSDIGFVFGTPLIGWANKRLRWDGGKIIDYDEYEELVYLYGVDPDPRIIELIAREGHQTIEECQDWLKLARERMRDVYFKRTGDAPWLVTRWKERDEWDVYVDRFIEEHKITGKRLEFAKGLLERSKRLRDYYKGKNISEFREAERDGDQKKLAHYEKLTERIFETVLVAGLKKLVPDEPTKTEADSADSRLGD